jgi:hypothetical protein
MQDVHPGFVQEESGLPSNDRQSQSGDCEKMSLEKAQGKLQKMETRQHDVLVDRAPLPLLSVLRPPPGF